jgi:hypothetical protein
MTKFVYFNDTKRIVSIHPATRTHGTDCDMSGIEPLEQRVFTLPEGTYPFVKMWDYGNSGLQILVSPHSEADDNHVKHEPIEEHENARRLLLKESMKDMFVKINPHDKKESR